MEEIPVFRAAKRRKQTRMQSGTALQTPVEDLRHRADGDHSDDEVGVSGLVRNRKQFRKPAGGVSFSNTSNAHVGSEDRFSSALVTSADINRPVDITQRFVSSSGQVVDVDQHMIDFVDSEMAKQRTDHASDVRAGNALHTGTNQQTTLNTSTLGSKASSADPASTRQLAEVDLGSLAQDVNYARTQAALERARTGRPAIEDEPKLPKPRKPRIGRDGKPMKPRPRKRRNSEDAARDALVEQLLRENRLDIYENDMEASRGTRGNEVTDEHIAEQFQQEYMDAMAERQQRTKTTTQPKTAAGAVAETKGPRLGGSRSARAKMAQMQQQQSGQAKK